MNVLELRAREPFDKVLRETLARGWSAQFGDSVEVLPERDGQEWYLSWPFGLYHLRRPAPPVRRFLADSFRFTPKRLRMPAQFVLGTLMSTRLGVARGSRFAFSVRPGLEYAEHVAVMPGNQRIRVLDFQSGRVRVLLKTNFEPHGMLRDLRFRARNQAAFLTPLLSWESGGGWFEEEILDGFVSLCRSAPWVLQSAVAAMVLQTWETWSRAKGAEQRHGTAYAREVGRKVTAHVLELDDRGMDASSVVDGPLLERLVPGCEGLDGVEVALSHGDFQPGNIMVAKGHVTDFRIIDWENVAQRSVWYDRLVLGLSSRYGGTLAERMARFIEGQPVSRFVDGLPQSKRWRIALLSLFALEELEWHLARAVEGQLEALPPALVGLAMAVRRFVFELS